MADFVVERIMRTNPNYHRELEWMMDEMRRNIGEFDDSRYRFTWIMQKPLMLDIMSNMPGLVKHTNWHSNRIFGIDVILESFWPGVNSRTIRLEAIDRTLHEYKPITYSPTYSPFDRHLLTVDPYKIRINASSLNPSSLNIKLDNEVSTMLNFNVKDSIKKVIYNEPATIVYWKDGTRTVVKCGENDTYSKETGLAMCIVKKITGNKGNYNDVFRKWVK